MMCLLEPKDIRLIYEQGGKRSRSLSEGSACVRRYEGASQRKGIVPLRSGVSMGAQQTTRRGIWKDINALAGKGALLQGRKKEADIVALGYRAELHRNRLARSGGS